MVKAYSRTYWENKPSDTSPINEANLNNIENGVDEIDNRVIALDTTKANKTEISTLISDISFNESTGTIIFTRKNGATITLDTKLEKIAVNFGYDAANEQLLFTLDDGTVMKVDISALITIYEFLDSDTIAFSVDSTGKVTAYVKEGSILEKHLQPNYLADIKVEVAKAESSADAAENSANEAEISADRAEQAAATAGWAEFDINEVGHLVFTKTENFETEFILTDVGRLEVILL